MSDKVRAPGDYWDLSDEELTVAPPKMLTPAQRKRRRMLKNRGANKRRQRARKDRVDQGRAKVIFCQGVTKKGDPCGSYAVEGAKHCRAHLNDAEQKKLNLKPLGEAIKEGRLKARQVNGLTLSAPQTMRQIMEVAVEKVISRYFLAVGFEFQGFDEAGLPIVYDKGPEHGLRLHGESKEGYVEMSRHPDLVAQLQVIEKMMDRVYGKPKQTQVIEGGVKPIQVQPVKSVDRAKRVASILSQVGAIPHEGRHRSQPSEPTTDQPTSAIETPASEGNVVPLHDSDS